ncbi:MAG: hypothetical protein ACM3OB_07315 [Acidobacteriota bacterium]
MRSLIQRAYGLAPFAVPFVLESIGLQACSGDGGELDLALAGADLPTEALILLHAGLGLATARAVFTTRLPPPATPLVECALARIAAWGHPDYTPIAIEALGLSLRTFRPRQFDILLARLHELDPQAAAFAAHGAGRALYFRPLRLLPVPDSAWRALLACRREFSSPELALEAEKGVLFAFVFVNLHRPRIAEALLSRHGDAVEHLDAWLPAFSAALLARAMTLPGDPAPERFVAHRPGDAVAERWGRLIASPGRAWLDALRGAAQ